MATYNPFLPPITLLGDTLSNSSGVLKYGVNDQTGLGPNGTDKYITSEIAINLPSNKAQSIGDASVRDSNGLGNGGEYNGLDVRVGDYISTQDGLKVFKIISISSKTSTGLTLVYEDVNMTIARQTGDNILTTGTNIMIFRLGDNGDPLLDLSISNILNVKSTLPSLQSYFDTFKNRNTFTFSPDITGSLELGDLVTITSSVDGVEVTPYRIVTASTSDFIIGSVNNLYGGNKVSITPFNNIITDFPVPEKLTSGSVGTTWYNSGSGKITTSSDAGPAKFFQLTNATVASITGSQNNPVFDETSYNLVINNIEVISRDEVSGNSSLGIQDITSSINSFYSQTFVTASIDFVAGNASVSTGDSGGTGGGEDGVLAFTSVGPIITTGYNASFAITASGGSSGTKQIEITPSTANQQLSGIDYADATQIVSDINTAATNASAPIVASVSGTGNTAIITIVTNDGGDLEINNNSDFTVGSNDYPCVGLSSGTGLPTGQFAAATEQKYLTILREDGGDILLQGTFFEQDSTNSAGLFSVAGTPPFLLQVEATGEGGADTDWFEGDTYLSASKDVRITGSLNILGDTISTGSTYIQGDLRVDGTASISHFHTLFETSSVIYNSGSTKFGDTLDDLHEITGSVEITGSLSIKDLAEDDTLTEVVVIDRTTGELKYKEETTGSASNIYSSSLADSIEMEEDVGGMPAGTTVGDLTLIESYNDLFDTILFPTGYPTLTAPSISATLSPSGLQIIGTEISSGNLSLTTTFNQGSIDPQYTATSGKRSGLPNTYNYSSTNTAFASSVSSTSLTDTVTNLLKYTVTAGANNFSVEVDHDAGVQPKDSKGNDFNSALSAGTVGPTTKTITGVYPVLATTSAIDTLTTQSLVVMTGYAEVDLVAEIFGQSDRQTVLIPTSVGSQAGWGTITIIEFFNTNSGNWEAINLNDWNITSSITKQIKGNPVNYTEFENKVGYPRGAGKYRFKA
jgi:hypothetical protein